MCIDEIMNARMLDVHEYIDQEDREDYGTQPSGHSMPFHEYMQTMLGMLEDKLEQLPEENRVHLSIQELIHYAGREKDNSDSSSQPDIEQMKMKLRKEIKKELEEAYNARLEKEAEARVQI